MGGRIYKVLWFVNKKAQYGVNMSLYVVCLVTIDDIDKAAHIAHELVEKRLVACVNIVSGIRSIYSWQGRVCDEKESLMIMKTRRELFLELQAAVKELHPYEVPEIISLPIDQGFPEYLRWIDESTSPTA
jgi:periplasmic divalent cation tolerance protein